MSRNSIICGKRIAIIVLSMVARRGLWRLGYSLRMRKPRTSWEAWERGAIRQCRKIVSEL